MARTGRRRAYGRRRYKLRRKSLRRKSIRKLKRRNGNYTAVKKFQARNPFGDRALVKLKFNYQGFLSGDGSSTQAMGTWSINDLADVYNKGLSSSISKGFLTYPKMFRRYRVNGAMVKFTVFAVQPVNAVGTAPTPLVAALIPFSEVDGTPTVVGQNPVTFTAQRHTKWTYVKNWAMGGGPSTVKKFFSLKHLAGNNYPKTDIDYSGVTDVTGNPYNQPETTWSFLAGFASVAGIALPTAASIHYNLTITYYVEYSEQVWEQQGL